MSNQRMLLLLTAGEHPRDFSTTLMMGATAAHILRTSEASGIDVELPKAVTSHYDRAIAAGLGTKNWTALYEVVRPGSVDHLSSTSWAA